MPGSGSRGWWRRRGGAQSGSVSSCLKGTASSRTESSPSAPDRSAARSARRQSTRRSRQRSGRRRSRDRETPPRARAPRPRVRSFRAARTGAREAPPLPGPGEVAQRLGDGAPDLRRRGGPALERRDESRLPARARLYAATPNPPSEGEVPRLARLKAGALSLLGGQGEAEALLPAGQATARANGLLPVVTWSPQSSAPSTCSRPRRRRTSWWVW